MTSYTNAQEQNSFNPRSHEGSDCHSFQKISGKSLFQSTLPRRERRIWVAVGIDVINVSIHAPTKGATIGSYTSSSSFIGFQSTLPRRERQIIFLLEILQGCFNPRSHEGSDDCFGLCCVQIRGFNPRSHEGSDNPGAVYIITYTYVSIHAPTKGATGMPSPCIRT